MNLKTQKWSYLSSWVQESAVFVDSDVVHQKCEQDEQRQALPCDKLNLKQWNKHGKTCECCNIHKMLDEDPDDIILFLQYERNKEQKRIEKRTFRHKASSDRARLDRPFQPSFTWRRLVAKRVFFFFILFGLCFSCIENNVEMDS